MTDVKKLEYEIMDMSDIYIFVQICLARNNS